MGRTDRMLADNALWDELDLGPNTRFFLKRVYAGGLDKYTRRLSALGFDGGERALDAGCGLGQWSFALAGMCREAWGVDVSRERVDACSRIAGRTGITNVHFVHGELERLPLETGAFDRVLCYSVLYQTYFERAIGELARVTRGSGLLYLSTNDIGRFLQHVISPSNSAPDFDPRAYGWRTLCNSARGRRTGLSMQMGGVVTRKANVVRLLRESGFEVIDCGPEGLTGGAEEPFMSGRYLGMTASFDVLARRR